jgi:hypothetical protein
MFAHPTIRTLAAFLDGAITGTEEAGTEATGTEGTDVRSRDRRAGLRQLSSRREERR